MAAVFLTLFHRKYLDLNEWPALAMFRNGLMVSFTEDVQAATEKQLADWLTAESTLKIIGVIDEVKLHFSLQMTFIYASLPGQP